MYYHINYTRDIGSQVLINQGTYISTPEYKKVASRNLDQDLIPPWILENYYNYSSKRGKACNPFCITRKIVVVLLQQEVLLLDNDDNDMERPEFIYPFPLSGNEDMDIWRNVENFYREKNIHYYYLEGERWSSGKQVLIDKLIQ